VMSFTVPLELKIAPVVAGPEGLYSCKMTKGGTLSALPYNWSNESRLDPGEKTLPTYCCAEAEGPEAASIKAVSANPRPRARRSLRRGVATQLVLLRESGVTATFENSRTASLRLVKERISA
jgi:hypothetical protein